MFTLLTSYSLSLLATTMGIKIALSSLRSPK